MGLRWDYDGIMMGFSGFIKRVMNNDGFCWDYYGYYDYYGIMINE